MTEMKMSPEDVLEQTLTYSRERDYAGYDYWDGLSSELLQSVPVENKWLNIAVQETIKRAPVNVRPLFSVPKRRSFMGSALFALANTTAFEYTGEEWYLEEAVSLVEWLLEERNDAPFGWDHNHPMQTLDTKVERNTTSSVVTVLFVSMAIIRLSSYRNIEGYSLIRDRVPPFIFHDLAYTEAETGAQIKYRPTDGDDSHTINANALGARLLLELYAEFDEDLYRTRAEAILDYVVAKQTAIGGWKYTDPPAASHLSMDNHHNGFIIESLLRHREIVETSRYSEAISKSLQFYKQTLYTPDGAPNWDETSQYPRDVHAAAQGIITFSMAGEFAFARTILEWTLENLYAGNGRFYYRKQRFYTKRFTLVRWCQAWMARALAVYINRGRRPTD